MFGRRRCGHRWPFVRDRHGTGRTPEPSSVPIGRASPACLPKDRWRRLKSASATASPSMAACRTSFDVPKIVARLSSKSSTPAAAIQIRQLAMSNPRSDNAGGIDFSSGYRTSFIFVSAGARPSRTCGASTIVDCATSASTATISRRSSTAKSAGCTWMDSARGCERPYDSTASRAACRAGRVRQQPAHHSSGHRRRQPCVGVEPTLLTPTTASFSRR
jgi:hypothetical protein